MRLTIHCILVMKTHKNTQNIENESTAKATINKKDNLYWKDATVYNIGKVYWL